MSAEIIHRFHEKGREAHLPSEHGRRLLQSTGRVVERVTALLSLASLLLVDGSGSDSSLLVLVVGSLVDEVGLGGTLRLESLDADAAYQTIACQHEPTGWEKSKVDDVRGDTDKEDPESDDDTNVPGEEAIGSQLSTLDKAVE